MGDDVDERPSLKDHVPSSWRMRVPRRGLGMLAVKRVAIALCLTHGGRLVMLSWRVLDGVACGLYGRMRVSGIWKMEVVPGICRVYRLVLLTGTPRTLAGV